MPRGNFGPPSHVCMRGHKLTHKTARWRWVTGKYLQVSCRLCESLRYKAYYQRRKALTAGLAAGDVDQIAGPGLAGGFGVHGVDFGLGVELDGTVACTPARD